MRYPIEPLAAAMRLSMNQAMLRLKVSGSAATQYRADGVSWEVAERLATRAGLHPAEVWTSWYADEFERCSKVCAADKCDVRFIADNPRRIYCCNVCRDRKVKARWARRRYEDPTFAAAERERLRQYHAEVRESRRMRAIAHAPCGEEGAITGQKPVSSSYSPQGAAGSITA